MKVSWRNLGRTEDPQTIAVLFFLVSLIVIDSTGPHRKASASIMRVSIYSAPLKDKRWLVMDLLHLAGACSARKAY